MLWKRQTLPSDNVQVHSFDSNVTIQDQVVVTSSNSRIELFESHFDATIWSSSSLLRFNPNDEYVNLTAQKAISKFNLNNAEFITFGQLYSLNETTNRKTDSESQLFLSLQNSVNLSLTDTTTQTQVEAINGRRAQINANTWDVQIARKLTLSSNVLQNLARELTITSVSNKYNVAIILDVELHTLKSPFDLSLTEEELLIRAPDENTALQIKPNSSDISINVNQISQMAVDRFGGGTVKLQSGGSSNGTQAEALQLDSQELSLQLFAGNETENAAIVSSSNHLTAGHHFIQILGGAPHLLLYTGNITLDVASNTQGISAVRLLPEFVPPEDQFQNIGPYGSDTDSNFTMINNPDKPINGNGSNGNGGQITTGGNNTEATVTAVTIKGNQGNPNQGGRQNTATTSTPNQGSVGSGSNQGSGQNSSNQVPGENGSNQNPGGTGSNQGPGGNGGDNTPTNPGFVVVTPTLIGSGENTPPSSGQSGANSIDNPISIEPSFPRPPNASDNFIIGQFGTEVAPTAPTIEDDFPVPPITVTTANTTEIFLISTSTPIRMHRDANAIATKDLMHIKLRVQRAANNSDDEDAIISDLEKNLSELVESALVNITEENSGNNSTRKKRMLNEVDVKVYDLIRNDAEPEEIVVKFYVDKPDYFRDLPFLATKLNAFGHQMLSEKLKYKVISPVKVQHNLSLGITIFAIVSALIIMIILIVITVQCTSQKKTWLKYYSKRRKVEDIPQMVTI
uniref:Uncharacterized protein n=1 Tax=Panagrolaimus sp. PS1159 TaxID=55785 RepID=A0AC35G510_9BILA